MALVSPGIEISVTDESQYLPTAVGTIPFLVVATAQDKTINGVIAPGTTKANANKIYGITSQRELANTFGTPIFRQTAASTPLHGDELNEYGLMAAYSALGLGNRAWVIRADIDLDQLVGTSSRPTGVPPNGRGWFDYTQSRFGIFEFDSTIATPNSPFVEKTPTFITSNVSTPDSSVGSIGDYAVIVSKSHNPIFKKVKNQDSTVTWESVGSSAWSQSIPVATTTLTTDSANLSANVINTDTTFYVNGTAITPAGNIQTMAGIASLLNASSATTGVSANVNTISGQLDFFISNAQIATSANLFNEATSNTSITSGAFGTIGIVAGNYTMAALSYGSYTEVPAWKRTDASPRPSGSVWAKTSAEGRGVNLVFKRYNSTTDAWVTLAAPVYADGYAALYGLDPSAGGAGIAVNTLFVKQDANKDGTLTYRTYYQKTTGQTKVTGTVTSPTFVNGNTFTITASRPGMATPITSGTCTINGTTLSAFVQAVISANLPNVTAYIENNKAVIVHRAGGIIVLTNTAGTPITTAGFTSSTAGVDSYIVTGSIALTNFAVHDYAVSSSQPFTNPTDGTFWYYNDPTAIDIMISDSTGWKGYKNVAADARGYDLTLTDPNGVIISPTEPEFQSGGEGSPLRSGDLWLDSSDLDAFPKLYRYNSATNLWSLIDNTDRISVNGIVFADARWDSSGTTDPITGDFPDIGDMLTSNYTDIDAPDYRLFPRGTLLFNTRRSGFTVKKFVVNYFNTTSFPGETMPTKTSTWVTQIGFNSAGQPLMGHYAQRNEIVQAMKSSLDSNLNLREEGYAFNLLAAPGYPELIPNLVLLNNDRSNTAFIIGDTPINLRSSVTAIAAHSATQPTASPYLGLYYPSALTTDLGGNEIAVPASHMMLRTFLYNDNVSYQWFAPAGTRRGLVDNALAIGYVDANSGTFVRTGINNQLRDSLYETLINPITLINGVGIVAYGQKTRAPTSSSTGAAVASGTSLDRINVARLVNYLRSILSGVANQFLFEPNDKITRDQVKSLIDSVMNDLIAKRGIYDYLVVCDETNNTPDRIARNELYVDIAIEPMKSVEFIYIPIRLKNPGTISGTATTVANA